MKGFAINKTQTMRKKLPGSCQVLLYNQLGMTMSIIASNIQLLNLIEPNVK
jgi:hypothetical protein